MPAKLQCLNQEDADKDHPSESSLLSCIQAARRFSAGVSSNVDVAAPSSDTEGNLIDLGFLVEASSGSMLHLRKLTEELPASKKMQFLHLHWKPSPSFCLRSHQVTKNKNSWTVSFQHSWLEKFPWLVYSKLLDGGICKFCILFPDASPYGIGACLSHEFEDGSERPVAFASRTLSSAEKGYAQIERESLAIITHWPKIYTGDRSQAFGQNSGT